ncbi:MAG: M48 family metallopeptidase [Desulfobacterales bacterium]|nr:M48 family metallopeptidase [Desulfobacterales bacterium]
MAAITDIECLRFNYESSLLREIESRLGAIPTISQMQSKNFLALRKRNLLGDAMLISPDLLPEVYEIYSNCLNLFGSNLQGNLFVRQSKEYNANIFSHNQKFDLLIHSALLEDFTSNELSFVLGHELGHALLGHSQVSMLELLSLTEELKPGLISPETKELMFRWSRTAEFSADRVGLLCCGQLESAAKALFKTLSGLSGISIDRILNSFHTQYDILEAQMEKCRNEQSWIGTHPMVPVRFKALELAALDIIFFRNQSSVFSQRGFRKVDQKISSILFTLDKYLSACNEI